MKDHSLRARNDAGSWRAFRWREHAAVIVLLQNRITISLKKTAKFLFLNAMPSTDID